MRKYSTKKCLLFPLSLLSVLVNLLLISCAENKISQCQKIILLTQKMAQESESYRRREDIKKVLQVADIFEETSQEYQMGFADIYQGNADTTRQFVAALNDKDIDTAKLMQQQVQQLGKKEQEFGAKMKDYCQDN